jgi:hypothetical protein
MFTLLILVGIGIAWFYWNKRYMRSGLYQHRRLRASWSWAFGGAIIGSFFGVAGFGAAIAGTIPGAFIGFLAAGYLMKQDPPADVVEPFDEYVLTKCARCSQVLRIPANKRLIVTCTTCRHQFNVVP